MIVSPSHIIASLLPINPRHSPVVVLNHTREPEQEACKRCKSSMQTHLHQVSISSQAYQAHSGAEPAHYQLLLVTCKLVFTSCDELTTTWLRSLGCLKIGFPLGYLSIGFPLWVTLALAFPYGLP